MNPNEDGAAAAASMPASRFAGALLDILDRVSYSRVNMSALDNPVYKLRYEAYRREEFVPFNDQGIVVDDLDQTPNAMCYGVLIDGELVSSIRLHHLTPMHRQSPSMNVCPDILGPLLDQGQRFIDPTRFTADYEASLAYPALPFLTLRLAVMATIFFRADMCLALVRPEHTAFYRRVFGSEQMSDTRDYPGLAFPVQLFGARVEGSRYQSIFSRFPFFLSNEDERNALFGPTAKIGTDAVVDATSRQAYERALAAAAYAAAEIA